MSDIWRKALQSTDCPLIRILPSSPNPFFVHKNRGTGKSFMFSEDKPLFTKTVGDYDIECTTHGCLGIWKYKFTILPHKAEGRRPVLAFVDKFSFDVQWQNKSLPENIQKYVESLAKRLDNLQILK